MATGNRKVDIYLKKFLTQQQITDNFFDFLEQKIHDVFTKLFPVNGVFEPNILVSRECLFELTCVPLSFVRGLHLSLVS